MLNLTLTILALAGGEGLTLGEPVLPEALRAAEPQHPGDPGVSRFRFGLRAGFMEQKDADDGVWFGGVQGRLFLSKWVAVEGSITFHQSEFLDGDVEVTQYPVQVTGLVFPFPDWQIKPYGLGGAGWYYTRTSYHGALSALDSETDNTFGFHFGAGAELPLKSNFSVSADIRYIFLDEPGVDNSTLEDEEWDFWQVTLAANFGF